MSERARARVTLQPHPSTRSPFLPPLSRAQDGDIRSKCRTVDAGKAVVGKLPDWNYDGSSTEQAPGSDSEVLIKPVAMFNDPFRGYPHKLVLFRRDENEMNETVFHILQIHAEIMQHSFILFMPLLRCSARASTRRRRHPWRATSALLARRS